MQATKNIASGAQDSLAVVKGLKTTADQIAGKAEFLAQKVGQFQV